MSTSGKFIFCAPHQPPHSDSEEIVHLIHRQEDKSTDLMNIPAFIYEILAFLISPSVSMFFNYSLNEGIFPHCFKPAKIIQIVLSGDSNSTANY